MKEQVAEITQKMSAAISSHEKWENEQANDKTLGKPKDSEGSSPECEKVKNFVAKSSPNH